MPKQLCIECKTKLDSYHEFAEICVEAEEKLRLLTKQKNFKVLKRDTQEATGLVPKSSESSNENNSKPSNIDLEMKPHCSNPLKLIGSDYCCPLCVEGCMTQDVDSEPDVQYDGMYVLLNNFLPKVFWTVSLLYVCVILHLFHFIPGIRKGN